MKLLTQDKIQEELKEMWDSVMKIQDQPLKEFAGKRVAAKEKVLKAKLYSQMSLIKQLDQNVCDGLFLLVNFCQQDDIYERLLDKLDNDVEMLEGMIRMFTLILNLLKQSL